MAASATFALKIGVWFRRGRLFMVSPDSLGTACPLSGRNSTYRPVQISETTSFGICRHDNERWHRDDRNRVRPMQHCNRSSGVGRLYGAQLAFARDALMRLAHAFYPVFKFSLALRQFFCDFIGAPRYVAAD